MTVIPLPRHAQWAWDLRGQGRGVRVSAHADEGLLNVSLWREGTCVGTAQLLPADVESRLAPPARRTMADRAQAVRTAIIERTRGGS